MHTIERKKLGHGIHHFPADGAKLIPEPDDDHYVEEAYRLWKLKRGDTEPGEA